MPEASPTLDLTLRSGDKPVLLAELRSAIDDFQGAISALAANLTNEESARVDFEVVGARIGSLSLSLRPLPEPKLDLPPLRLLETFSSDLKSIRNNEFRDDMSPPLADRYRSLVRGIRRRGQTVELMFDSQPLLIDRDFQTGFEASFKERTAVEAEYVGHLDAIRAHSAPFVFLLYPKLSGFGKMECRFPESMIDRVRPLLKQVVRVKGRATYGPIGLYPGRIEVEAVPELVGFDKAGLLRRIGSMSLLEKGQTIQSYLAGNREAAGLGD